MQFIDEAKIYVKSGDGGNGCTSFRREAHVPRGGPDGGNGGRGGSIIFRCVPGLNTLIDFRYTQHFKARKGENGKGKCREGASADDIIISVPSGTQVFMEDGKTLLFDITEVGEQIVVLKGGKGGLGNVNFKTSTNQAPRKSTPGEVGNEMWVWLRLKLLSDVGIAGLPNAGKSTFVSRVTRARPRIADYPFTTLKPQLGVFYIDGSEFVIADIPGLIENAHQGQGLGHRFLRHIERCAVILHLIDANSDDVTANYKMIRNELVQYSSELAEKQEVVVLNKCDLLTDDMIHEKKKLFAGEFGIEVMAISSVTGQGVEEVLRTLKENIELSGEN